MREKSGGKSGSTLMDVFEIFPNSSNCNKAINLDGELEVASILFKYEISCSNLSSCGPALNNSLTACSKISEMHT